MPKRRTSTAAACPVCTIKFDPEIHIPFMGSCGDSICAVCVDEKKIEACPVCEKERAFLPKKKNNLALELLKTITEMEASYSKKAKLDVGEDAPGELVSRRQISMEMACPGCSSVFDIDAHVPFVGSCGHSICAICLNETKVTKCPVCRNPGGFLSKQKNELATDMLTASAENGAKDSKKVNLDVGEETCASGESIPAILNPNNRPFLAQIVNQLNPTSFLTLSRSCKALHDYCFNSNDIKVIHHIHSMHVFEENPSKLKFYLRELGQEEEHRNRNNLHYTDYSGFQAGFLSSATGRKILQKYPFVFRLDEIKFYSFGITSQFHPSLRSFLAEFPILKIIHVNTSTSMFKEWKSLLQFLKDFHVESVRIWYRDKEFAEVDDELIEEAFTYLLQNFKSFEYNREIDKRLLLNASVPVLTLTKASISWNTFLDLITKLADWTGDIDWIIGGHTQFDFNYETLFSFNVKSFDYNGPVPEERPLFFVKDDDPDVYWLLRNDGRVLKCRQGDYQQELCIRIYMCRLRDYPRCLWRQSRRL